MNEINAKNVKAEVQKGVDTITMLKDEVKLHLHLASLDAKKEWDEKLEPQIAKLGDLKDEIAEKPGSLLKDLESKLEQFLARIRPVTQP